MNHPVACFDRVGKDYPQGWLGRSQIRAVDQVSFRVEPGEVVGLLGPNRAGKTTLVKLLLSLCQPTHGRVERFGRPADDQRTLARIGYIHENQALPRYLSASSLLEYYGALSLLSESDVRARAPGLLERVGLADRSREPIAGFSKGMIQRLSLAQALLHDPELLVFDEPNEGLDLTGRKLLRDILIEQKRRGRSALYVSHVIPEVEQVCDRVAVLAAGRLVFWGALAELRRDPQTGADRPLSAALDALCRNPSSN
jgi:ABC-2 type transport system ATP-binding protein